MSYALAIQFLLCPVVLISLLYVAAPYGRHHRAGWGPNLPNRAAWAIMELPALLTIAILVVPQGIWNSPQVWIPLLFWLFHYSYRTFVFPLLMRPSDRSFPIMLVVFAIGFNVLNGYNNSEALIAARGDPFSPGNWHFITGALLFMAGFCIHFKADQTIRRLRRKGETGYSIPTGGLYRWVSSPGYLGEIIQWTGWAIMTWSAAGLAFALFTFCNLAPRAIANHRWYRERFADYPVDRKILIPGIF